MNTDLIIYISSLINVGINSFLIGKISDDLSEYNFLGRFIIIMGLSFFGTTLLILYGIYRGFKLIWNQFCSITQWRFFYDFYFTDKWTTGENVSIFHLAYLNRMAIKKHTSSSIEDRIFRHVVDLINKRHGFVYNEENF
jgi:hypothetical protein